jgi:hypothetical protein
MRDSDTSFDVVVAFEERASVSSADVTHRFCATCIGPTQRQQFRLV